MHQVKRRQLSEAEQCELAALEDMIQAEADESSDGSVPVDLILRRLDLLIEPCEEGSSRSDFRRSQS